MDGIAQASENANELKSTEAEQEVRNEREKRDLEILRQSYVKIREENYAKMITVLGFFSTYPEFINTTHNTLMQVAGQLGRKE